MSSSKKVLLCQDAQLNYERTLNDSRSVKIIIDDELTELDNLIGPLIKNNQSNYHIKKVI